MIELLVLGVGLMVVAALGVVLVEALARRAELGAGLLLAMTVLTATLVGRVPALTLPGDIRVQLHDLAFALVLAAAVLRLLRMPRFSGFQRWLLLLGCMLLVSLVRGAVTFGIERSVAEFRLYLAFASGALYVATFPPSTWVNDRIGRIWLAMSVAMMALVCVRWLANFAGIDLGVPPERFGADAAIRVLDGPYTFFLASAAILTAPFWQLRDDRARKLTRFGALLLVFVVLLNRRTVWLALLVGIAVIILRNRRLQRPAVAMAIGAVLVTAGVYAAFAGSGTTEEPVARSAVSTGTLSWRVEGWSLLLAHLSEGPATWVAGQPFGSGFARTVEESEVEAEPHNFYLTTLLRSGVVGLLALLAVSVGLLRALWRVPVGGGGLLAPGIFPALLAMQIVWFFTWLPGMEQGIVTGLAVALASTITRGRPPFPRLGRRPDPLAGRGGPAPAPSPMREYGAADGDGNTQG